MPEQPTLSDPKTPPPTPPPTTPPEKPDRVAPSYRDPKSGDQTPDDDHDHDAPPARK